MKTDNALMEPKIELRRYFLQKYKPSRVLECCQGSGVLWSILQKEFDVSLIGFDVKPKRGRLKVDSSRLMYLPDINYDVIDIDTYGSPWKHYLPLVENLSCSATIFLTIGMIKMGGGGNMDNKCRKVIGLNKIKIIPPSILTRDTILQLSINSCIYEAEKNNFKIIETVEAFPQKNAKYIGIRLEKLY